MYDSIIRLSLFHCVFYSYIPLRIIPPKILWNKKYWQIWKNSGFETSSHVFCFKNFPLNSHIAYSNVDAYCTQNWNIYSLCTRKQVCRQIWILYSLPVKFLLLIPIFKHTMDHAIFHPYLHGIFSSWKTPNFEVTFKLVTSTFSNGTRKTGIFNPLAKSPAFKLY